MRMVHVTIHTEVFEEEIRFYQETAGLVIERDMRPMGRDMVFLSNSEGETCVEIIREQGAVNAGNPSLSIGFKCADPEAMREKLLAEGMECSPMVSPNPKTKFFFVTDPAGVRVQFI